MRFTLIITLLMVFVIIMISCSDSEEVKTTEKVETTDDEDELDEDDDGEVGQASSNYLMIGDEEYQLGLLKINDETRGNPQVDIELLFTNITSKKINSESDLEEVLDVHIDFQEDSFDVGVYDLLDQEDFYYVDYHIYTGGSRIDGVYTPGEEHLNNFSQESYLSSAKMEIKFFSPDSIALEFLLTRLDGVKIIGNYEGAYTDIEPPNRELEGSLVMEDTNDELHYLQIRNENGKFSSPSNPSDIEFNLSNKSFDALDSSDDLTDILTIYFEYKDTKIKAGEYDLINNEYTDYLSYRVVKGGTRIDGEYEQGEYVVSSIEPEKKLIEAVVIINEVQLPSVVNYSYIDLEFTFKREDGVILSGAYNGFFRGLSL